MTRDEKKGELVEVVFIADCGGNLPNGKPDPRATFKRGQKATLPEASANRWMRRGKAVIPEGAGEVLKKTAQVRTPGNNPPQNGNETPLPGWSKKKLQEFATLNEIELEGLTRRDEMFTKIMATIDGDKDTTGDGGGDGGDGGAGGDGDSKED